MFRTALFSLAVAVAPFGSAMAQQPAAASSSSRATSSLRIPYDKYMLPNGLTVVLSPDHATPTVAVEVMYHVASKNEKPGHTGFAHMFEHVMFTGSAHVPYGFHDKYTEGVGGSNNGSTGNDVTQYYETIPSNYLETSLWMEADRMGWLLDSLDEAKFRAQRDIVKNERRQSADNVPYARDREVIEMTMFPDPNPYSWPVVGSMADLGAATVEDVKQFFRTYYVPNNATLVIAGDFDPRQAKAWVAKYFTDIPRGKPIVRPVVPASPLTSEKRLTFEDRVQVPQLSIAWPTVGESNPDRYALALLSDILGSSRTARLTKALVYDTQSAANAGTFSSNDESIGEFMVFATPRPGHSLTELETIADSVLDQLKRTGPTADELQRAKARREASFLNGLQSNLGKAVRLASDQTLFNDPGHSVSVDYPRTQAVTAADIKRVANKYLGSARVVLSNVPIGKTDLASHAAKSTVVTDPFTEKTADIRP